MRLFTALRFPGNTISALEDIVEKAKLEDPHARYVRPDQFHLTLDFIGETENLTGCEDALEEACLTYQERYGTPVELVFSQIGTFKSKGGAILWAGIKPNPSLSKLEKILREKLEERGFSLDTRPYKPHITLARKFTGSTAALKEEILLPEPVSLTQAALVWSHRVDGLLMYEDVKTIEFCQ